jgi:hypothetical protein
VVHSGGAIENGTQIAIQKRFLELIRHKNEQFVVRVAARQKLADVYV